MVVGLGSNLGDRRAALKGALAALRAAPGIELVACSSLWQTPPVGGPPQDDYYNAAALLRTSLEPEALLAVLLDIEAQFGRRRTGRNLPRTLDLDLLWIDGTAVSAPGLEVPHPRLHERAFALTPLVEVAPEACDPRTGMPYARILASTDRTGIRRLPWGGAPR
jgi:2-amino-4-hydroxy-6-hydroxymethyldihydropteridine diphosphokinase